ncbi:MAG: SMI1/KNR4 family protein [Lachnospiraceae bacterium]|nr:SMI1/KNR4 family protein [Lachnospiraceae bacterium]
MDKWKERLVEMLMVRNELYKADKGQLWEYHYPEVAAELSEILLAQEKLKIKLSQDYIDFLLCANGWKCFYQLVDLFGTKDFEAKNMSLAKMLLNTELEYDESLNDIKEYLFPIAVSRTDKDLFVMVLTEGSEYGQIIWLAGGEIERFLSFSDFFEAMIEYNKEELEDILDENMD